MATKVHPITGAEMLFQFQHAIAYRFAITKISCLQAFEANTNLGLDLLIPQGLEPFGQWLLARFGLVSKYFNHGNNVAYKLPHGKSFDSVKIGFEYAGELPQLAHSGSLRMPVMSNFQQIHLLLTATQHSQPQSHAEPGDIARDDSQPLLAAAG